jgi:hypothetical protein
MQYPKEVRDTILQQLGEGIPLKKICERQGMPSRMQVTRWVLEDEEFAYSYRQARLLGAEANEDEVRLLIQQAIEKPEMANAVRVAMDGYKWLTGVTNPAKYGQKQELTVKEEAKTPEEVQSRIKALETELQGLMNQSTAQAETAEAERAEAETAGAQRLDVTPPRAQPPLH